MQIDGHHTATYVAARFAGFDHADAEIVSYAAQYVDDATNGGVVWFSDSEYLYSRIASAHSMIDPNNLIAAENHLAWLPFHFLPGNGLLPAGQEPAGGELAKLACRPDSLVARDVLRLAVRDRDKPRGLQRLGITMHVYADTFAHQGFVGGMSKGNRATNVTSGDVALDQRIRATTKTELLDGAIRQAKAVVQLIKKAVQMMVQEHKSPVRYIRDFLNADPLGHAAVDTFPDQPYLSWQYIDYTNAPIKRDNPLLYVHAMNMMVRAMKAWRAADESMDLDKYSGMDARDENTVAEMIRRIQDPKGDVRHGQWREALASGAFSFGPVDLDYAAKGPGSWKEAALGTLKSKDTGLETYAYSSAFLNSHWKLFHDAIQAHRNDVVHDVLPRYGICAA
jgi:hypothetical protein